MVWVIIWIICATAAGLVGKSKGRTGQGWALGIFLGLIGLIIIAVLPAVDANVEKEKVESGDMKKCPFCAELIRQDARVCRYCGRDMPDTEASGIDDILGKEAPDLRFSSDDQEGKESAEV